VLRERGDLYFMTFEETNKFLNIQAVLTDENTKSDHTVKESYFSPLNMHKCS